MSSVPSVASPVTGFDPAHRLQGESRAVRTLRETLRRVGPRDAPVLLLGESGTGKELAARIVHDLSPRREAAFVPVDCGAFSESVLESELGYFTMIDAVASEGVEGERGLSS